MTLRELEIIKAALEGDVIRQKESDKSRQPEFKRWLKDTKNLLRKVSQELFRLKGIQSTLDERRGK